MATEGTQPAYGDVAGANVTREEVAGKERRFRVRGLTKRGKESVLEMLTLVRLVSVNRGFRRSTQRRSTRDVPCRVSPLPRE